MLSQAAHAFVHVASDNPQDVVEKMIRAIEQVRSVESHDHTSVSR